MHILSNRFKVRERNGMIVWHDDNGGVQLIVKMTPQEKKKLVKSIKSLRYFDRLNGLRRNQRPIGASREEQVRYRIEREFVKRFDIVSAYIEAMKSEKDKVIMSAYKGVFSESAYDMDSFMRFKEMFLELVDVYQRTVKDN